MSSLLYREDMDDVRARLTTWWNGGDLGRPAMQVTVPREKPLEKIPAMAKPEGWITDYSMSNFEYRVYLARTAFSKKQLLGEASPAISPHVGAGSVAMYMGSRGEERPGTVWFHPCMESPETGRFDYDEENAAWQFTLRLSREMAALAKGKMLVELPDMIEGLDILASMRGTQELLTDLIERPEWVHASLRQITDRYFRYYDMLYKIMRDEVGGSIYWAWAPNRVAKLQCDFSAMISPGMFKEFMIPVLKEMTSRLCYSLYHWDGPGAIPHHDALLALPDLDMIQWTPGAGVVETPDPRWWPLYHKTVDAGKKLFLHIPWSNSLESVRALRKEFGPKLKQFMIVTGAKSLEEGKQLMREVEV